MSRHADDIDRLMSQTLDALRTARGDGAGTDDMEQLRGEGTGLGGLVRVTARPGDSYQATEEAVLADLAAIDGRLAG
jgi:hypothetical protein